MIWVSGNLSGVGDGFSNTSLVLVEHVYNQLDPISCQVAGGVAGAQLGAWLMAVYVRFDAMIGYDMVRCNDML